MAITLQDFATGDTNYISKLNANNATLTNAVNTLQGTTTGATSSSSGNYLPALLGSTAVRIGSSSYTQTNSGSTFTLSSGSAWKPSTGAVVAASTSTSLSFSGRAAGTYYIIPDASGTPGISTTSTADSLYSVSWDGANFVGVTSTASVMLSAADETALLYSSHFATTFATLAARLNAIESHLP